jgi:hypothetical protein
MGELYPEITPFAQGMLEVGEGHLVYWESCGNPLGKPALGLHGGPGSGAGAFWRRFFDPTLYRVVLFDQRGCGRSRPDAHRLAGIPGVLVHGRLDLGSPVDIPWGLAKVWPEATLELIDEAGHGTGGRQPRSHRRLGPLRRASVLIGRSRCLSHCDRPHALQHRPRWRVLPPDLVVRGPAWDREGPV